MLKNILINYVSGLKYCKTFKITSYILSVLNLSFEVIDILKINNINFPFIKNKYLKTIKTSYVNEPTKIVGYPS